MAVIKYSALVTEIKGKIGGTVFQGGYPNPIIKNNGFIRKKVTSDWQEAKQRLSYVASHWRNLTDFQKGQFAAQAPNFPATDKFGNTYTPSAYQLFCTLNNNRRLIGLSLLTAPASPVAEQDLSPFAVTYTDPDNIAVTYTPLVNTNYSIVLYASRPQSQGVESQPQLMKFLKYWEDDTTGSENIATELKAAMGGIQDGEKYFIRAYVIRHGNGRKYGNYLDTFIVG